MKLPPDIQFHEDIRLLIYRPHGLVNEATVNKIVSVIGELEATLKEPFNRFSDTLAADAVDLNFEYVIRMKTKHQLIGLCLSSVFVLVIVVSSAPCALAVEGGLGRPISGMQIAPYAGVIPPEPGLAVATGETYYEGSIGGGRSVPIAGLLVANVDMKASFTPIALFYIWPTPTKEWNFASAVSFPLAWLEVTANLSLGPLSIRKTESTFGLFDLVFTPIVASHHFSQTDHLAFSFTFWAPTGSFEKGRLVNLSQNTWTFIPGVAYTKILPQANIELTGIWDMEFDTEDRATRYQNGILSDLEVLVIKRFKNGLGIGFIESWIQQVTDDEGSVPAGLHGFRGR